MAKTRQIGEIFEYMGKTYKVVKTRKIDSCGDCHFGRKGVTGCNSEVGEVVGECGGMAREDHTYVIFKEVK